MLLTGICLAGLVEVPSVYAAGVTVPSDVRILADSLKKESDELAIREKAAIDAQNNIVKMQTRLEFLQDREAAQADEDCLMQLEKAKQDWKVKLTQQEELEMERKALAGQLHDVNVVLEEKRTRFNVLEDDLKSGASGERADIEYAEQLQLDDVINDLAQQDKTIYAQIQALDYELVKVQTELAQIEEKNAVLAKQAETAIGHADREKLIKVLQEDIKSEQKNLQEYEQFSVQNRKAQSFSTASKFYSWSDDKGNSGTQFYQPIQYGIIDGAMEYSLKTGLTSSNNKSEENGEVHTLTDTVLTASYTKPLKKEDALFYILKMNLPTGKDALRGNDPIMTDDLVENNRFGRGFDFSPEFWWQHKVNTKNIFRVGMYYNFLGSYDLDSTDSFSRIQPGNSWVTDVQWKFLDSKVQYLAEIAYTKYGISRERGIEYRSGNRLAPNFTINYAPDKTQFFTLYWWNTNEQPLSDTTIAAVQETRIGNNIGIQWAKSISNVGRWKLGFDYLRRNGENYDPVTNLTTNHRRKVTYGIGYDWYMGKENTETLGIDFEWFHMSDTGEGVIENDYHGQNVYLHYTRNF